MRIHQGIVCLLTLALVALGSTATAGDWFGFSKGKTERGSGDITTEVRKIEPFTRIKLVGSADLHIVVGRELSLEVTTDDNLQDNVITEVAGRRTLRIGSEGNIRTRHGIKVKISVPSLERLALTGSGDILVEKLAGDDFEVKLSGSGDIDLEGRVGRLEITLAGSGDINARGLRADEADVSLSGSGDISVWAKDSFDGSLFGSGDIDVYGDPRHRNRSVHGSGDISYH